MHPNHRVGLPRRELLRLGLLGAGGLTLSGLQRLRATTRTSAQPAIIVVWLPGGLPGGLVALLPGFTPANRTMA